jgi:hypothetical protein
MLTNEIVKLLITPGVLLFIFIVVWRATGVAVKAYKRDKYIEKFSDYRSILEYHMEKAYDMIHKEHILAYSLDAYRIDDKDYDKISKSFVKLVIKFVGPSLLKEFIYLYGDEDTFTFNVLEYFSTKYENDEIRNTAMDQLTDTEVDEKATSTTPVGMNL